MWEVEYTDQFGQWWEALPDSDQEKVTAAVELLEESGAGPRLGALLLTRSKDRGTPT